MPPVSLDWRRHKIYNWTRRHVGCSAVQRVRSDLCSGPF